MLPAQQRGGNLSWRREHPLSSFRREMDSLFDRFFGSWPTAFGEEGLQNFWDFGVTENDKEVVVRAEVPGFEENELDVQLNNDTLTIKAEKQQKGDGHQSYRRFYRSVTLPAGVQADKAQATYRNGVLKLRLPRSEQAKGRRIPIQGLRAAPGQPSLSAGSTSGQQAGSQQATAAPQKGKK
jgi:HSP20 family protein